MIAKTTISIFTLLLLLATMLLVQSHLKAMPAIILASYTSATILAFILKRDKLSTVLLVLIVFLSASFFWFLLIGEIKELLFPPPPFNGHFVMDTSFVFYIPAAIVLGAATTFLYFKKAIRNNKAELYGLGAYLVATVILIFRHELY